MTGAAARIVARLPAMPVAGLEPIRLHRATPESKLGRSTGAAPYWAYLWAGGLALAHHLRARPEAVAGKRVLDLGAGSGLVGIAAALAGAADVIAAEVDPHACAAIALNAALNGVSIQILEGDLLRQETVPEIDLILVGDLFYDHELAGRVTAFLDRAGVPAIVGDPGRAPLPAGRLFEISRYAVAETGARVTPGAVYRFVAQESGISPDFAPAKIF